ncbi:MAG: hypothetical protein JO031_02310 [Ktedonobacteraceae bacterium]|nr:hypothetical protein [Ktedonobacteraceae bacterium]
MRVLTWKLSKARVWLNELPSYNYQAIDTIEQKRDFSETKRVTNRECAIELYNPVGPRAYYGAIGASFTPQKTGNFIIQVPVSIDKGPLLDNSLAGKSDEVYIGLPLAYVDGVLSGFISDNTIQQLGSGTLRINNAAHGSIGSSLWLFRVLSRVLSNLFLYENSSVSDEFLIKLISTELLQR